MSPVECGCGLEGMGAVPVRAGIRPASTASTAWEAIKYLKTGDAGSLVVCFFKICKKFGFNALNGYFSIPSFRVLTCVIRGLK
ncbi:hypothetical protein [Azohydromonas caseinilytica]|uniref:Uncharacterized protein n=1 Tax=Azohydromonas caseinilytica TaxID=2728836 RepID=A0A848F750_9BURK|nr:hypothetical protein [Azohydromonas caseinilytica]NML14566.1 hypothetical protein [Azohydromonas caseinilytica]